MSFTRSKALVAGGALLALTGCGSTVQTTSTQTVGTSDGVTQLQGEAAPSGTSAGSAPVGPTGTTVAGSPGRTGGSVAAPGSPSTGPVSPGTVAGTPTGVPGRGSIPVSGPGWDAKYVYLGVTTQKDVQAAFANAGANGLDAGDQEGQAKAVAAVLNQRGGLFGRQIKLVFKDQSTVSTAQDPDTAGAATCTYFTQDHPVIALINPVTLMDVASFRACLAKHRVPLLSATVTAVDDQVGRALAPYFYQSVAPSWNELAPVLIQQLKAEGYFGGWNPLTSKPAATKPKIGLLVASDDVGIRVGKLLSKDFADAGYPGAVVYQYAKGNTDLSSAVVQFNGNGVTHVLVADSTLLPFQLSAESQGYRPRYAVTSYNAPLAYLQANGPKNQQVGAVGAGWAPSFDVDDAHDPGSTGPGDAECRAMLAKGGQTFSGKRLALTLALALCDGIRLMAEGAVAGGGLTGQQIYQGVQKVSPTFSTAFSFANGLGPNRLFIPGAVRPLAWDTGCSCYLYTSRQNAKI